MNKKTKDGNNEKIEQEIEMYMYKVSLITV